MELASTREPWTAAVAWARPWHRPLRRGPATSTTTPRGDASAAGGSAGTETVRDGEWRAAVLHLEHVRQRCAALEPDSDFWTAVMSDHEVYLAARRVRTLAEHLDLTVGRLAGC